jgi:negative regulator of flagellin synthesis FlgM
MNVKQLSAVGYTTASSASKQGVAVAANGSPPHAKSMQVALSAASQALYDSDNDIDMARVSAIRQALSDGTLVINPERIAQGLIDSTKDLL